MSVVEFSSEKDVARIALNRPHRLNAVVPELVEELVGALRRAQDEGVRAVVLAGNGRSFCSGHDLKAEPPPLDPSESLARLDRIQQVTREIRRAPFPVIAAVHGYALGAGCEFALGCDLVVAGEDAQFGFPEVDVGLSVTGGISRLLSTALGVIKAKELVLLGGRFGAAEAARLGLVTRLVPAGSHETVAFGLADELAKKPAYALALAKHCLDQGLDGTVEEAFAREVANAQLTEYAGEADRARDEWQAR